MSDDADVDAMQQVRSGDGEAFRTIVDRYKNPLVNYLTHLTGSRESAEDYAQEAFVRLFEHASSYEEQGKLSPYLFRIATNLVRTDFRRRLRWKNIAPLFGIHSNGNGSSPQRQAIEDEVRREVSRAIEALPLTFRAPLVLHEMEDWSYQEIAEALSANEGTVKSRINRARQRLKSELAPYWNGGLAHE